VPWLRENYYPLIFYIFLFGVLFPREGLIPDMIQPCFHRWLTGVNGSVALDRRIGLTGVFVVGMGVWSVPA
jgi:hypothetical protein